MKFQREDAIDVIEEIKPLIADHYDEISHYKHIQLNPNWDRYKDLDKLGVLRIYTARDDATNALVGYAIFFVNKNMHYVDSLQANQDILFLVKEKRGHGGRFIMWCDSRLKEEGVQVVYHHIKVAHDHPELFQRLGYTCVDKIYSKEL